MSQPRIDPPRITKPLQLLAAWLAGLIVTNGTFLGAAATISTPQWIPICLVIAAIFNVPLFLVCIFVLQTKYRPEMQEDTYYARYLDSQTLTIRSSEGIDISQLRTDIYEGNARTLEIIESLRGRLATLIDSIDSTSNSGSQLKLQALNAQLDDVSETIADAKQRAEWGRYEISLNNLLPRYDDISQALAALSIQVTHTFGSTSHDPEQPKVGILSFGRTVDLSAIRELVTMLSPLGISALSYSEGDERAANIYIGSYIYHDGPQAYTPVHGEVEETLFNQQMTIQKFQGFLKQRVRRKG